MCRRKCDLKVAEMGCTALPLGSRQDLEPTDERAADSHAMVGRLILPSLQLGLSGEGNEQARLLAPALLALKALGVLLPSSLCVRNKSPLAPSFLDGLHGPRKQGRILDLGLGLS